MKIDLLNHLVLKFNHLSDIHEEWAKDKERLLQIQDLRNCNLNDIRQMRKRHEIFVLEMKTQMTKVKQIVSAALELNSFGYIDLNGINCRTQRINEQWDRLLVQTHQRNIIILEQEQILQKLDDLHLDFATRVVPFNNWLDGALQDLMDVFIVRFIKELQQLVDASEQFKTKFLEAERQHYSIISLSQQIDSITTQFQITRGRYNPYTQLTARVSHYFI